MVGGNEAYKAKGQSDNVGCWRYTSTVVDIEEYAGKCA